MSLPTRRLRALRTRFRDPSRPVGSEPYEPVSATRADP